MFTEVIKKEQFYAVRSFPQGMQGPLQVFVYERIQIQAGEHVKLLYDRRFEEELPGALKHSENWVEKLVECWDLHECTRENYIQKMQEQYGVHAGAPVPVATVIPGVYPSRPAFQVNEDDLADILERHGVRSFREKRMAIEAIADLLKP